MKDESNAVAAVDCGSDSPPSFAAIILDDCFREIPPKDLQMLSFFDGLQTADKYLFTLATKCLKLATALRVIKCRKGNEADEVREEVRETLANQLGDGVLVMLNLFEAAFESSDGFCYRKGDVSYFANILGESFEQVRGTDALGKFLSWQIAQAQNITQMYCGIDDRGLPCGHFPPDNEPKYVKTPWGLIIWFGCLCLAVGYALGSAYR